MPDTPVSSPGKKEMEEMEKKKLREDANIKLCLIDTTSNFPKLSLSPT